MRILRRLMLLGLVLIGTGRMESVLAQAPKTNAWPDFQEVYGLISSNLNLLTDVDLNRSAIRGLLAELHPLILIATNRPASDQLITRTNVFEGIFGYVRVGAVEPGLAKEIAAAYQQLGGDKKLKGLVLDLRYANGHDYPAAVEAADLFITGEQPLLKLKDATLSSTGKSSALELPLVVLVNRATAGAAEALAAVLRQTKVALTIGSDTAGQAHLFKEFPLQNGQRLRIAVGPITLANGSELSKNGFKPDIQIEVNRDDEKAYFADPYRTSPKLFAQSVRPATNDLAGVFGTNRFSRRRINESELLRLQREGLDLNTDPDSDPAPSEKPLVPVINDPALARGLDFLKGVTLVQGRR